MKTIASLKIGEKAIISGFRDSDLSIKFLEMGCLPGLEVFITRIAPFGSPICIKVLGYNLALRKDEADQIFIQQ